MTVLLTDAPGDFKKAVVTIEAISLQGDADGSLVVLRDTAVTTDLITLANDTAALLTDVDVPAGNYTQLRFVISGAYVEVDDGLGGTAIYASSPTYPGLPAGAHVDGDLQMPSYDSSGLKIDIGAVRVDGNQQVILVDFDVAQSFGHDTGTTKWVMHPVIKGAELTLSGDVTVRVTKEPSFTLPVGVSMGDLEVTLTNSAGSIERLLVTDADADGTFEASFRYLIPGQFVIDFVGPVGTSPQTNPSRPTTVTLASGESLLRSYVLLGL